MNRPKYCPIKQGSSLSSSSSIYHCFLRLMAREQIRIGIADAVIVPILALDSTENLEVVGDFLFRINVYVEEP